MNALTWTERQFERYSDAATLTADLRSNPKKTWDVLNYLLHSLSVNPPSAQDFPKGLSEAQRAQFFSALKSAQVFAEIVNNRSVLNYINDASLAAAVIAKIPLKDRKVYLTLRDENNQTPIMKAYDANNASLVELLHKSQADSLLFIYSWNDKNICIPVAVDSDLLSHHSEVFRSLFNNIKSQTSGPINLSVQTQHPEVLKQILISLYVDHLAITEANFRQLADTARCFRLCSVHVKLMQWLQEHPECDHLKNTLTLLDPTF